VLVLFISQPEETQKGKNMQLGAIDPVQRAGVTQVAPTRNPQAPQAPAQTNSAVSSGNEQTAPGEPFSPENLKKWAPWIIGAVLLYVLLNKKR
jgi:hypothetical protein